MVAMIFTLGMAIYLLVDMPIPARKVQPAKYLRIQAKAGGFTRSSCSTFGIEVLQRVGMMSDAYDPESDHEPFGQFAYATCPSLDTAAGLDVTSTSVARENTRRFAVLTVVDSNYLEVLPTWAAQVQSLGQRCVVMAVDDKTCGTALMLGCDCFPSSASHQDLRTASGWHQNRVHSVKLRFEGARYLLSEGYDVLMHDADVLFKEAGLEHVMSYWSSHGHNYDFMVQDNGIRKVNFDGLNWGFVFMRSTKSSISLLSCTLERWDDPAFGCGKKRCDSYYLRSQPRINHILELALRSPRGISVCKLPALKSFGAVHMTGYPTVAAKLTCAKAAGFLFNASIHRIAYDVPSSADVPSQRIALQNAVAIATQLGAKLEIPKAFVDREEQNFCRLFDVMRIASILAAPSSSCTNNTLVLVRVAQQSFVDTTERRICIDFQDVLNSPSHSHARYQIPVCDPKDPTYDKIHCCERKDGSDDAGTLLL